MDIYISLTSIPPRIILPSFQTHLHSLCTQYQPVTKIIVNIPKTYQRPFRSEDLQQSQSVLKKLMDQYPQLLYVHLLDQDYGPASKYMGPLLLHEQNRFNLENQIIIICDDDSYYSPYTSQLYFQFFQETKSLSIPFATGNRYLYFVTTLYDHLSKTNIEVSFVENKRRSVCGFMSFAFQLNNKYLHLLQTYTLHILNLYPDSFFHDEGILLNFIWALRLTVYHIQFPFITRKETECTEALVETPGVHHFRKTIEKNIRSLTLRHGLLPVQTPIYSTQSLESAHKLFKLF